MNDRIAQIGQRARENGTAKQDPTVVSRVDPTIVREGPAPRVATCAHCSKEFAAGSRGQLPRFCSSDCRAQGEGKQRARSRPGGKPQTPRKASRQPKAQPVRPAPESASTAQTRYLDFLLDRLDASPSSDLLDRIFRVAGSSLDDEHLDRIERALG